LKRDATELFYSIHNSTSLPPFLNLPTQSTNPHSNYLQITLNASLLPTYMSPRLSLTFSFSHKTSYAFLHFPILSIFLAHLIALFKIKLLDKCIRPCIICSNKPVFYGEVSVPTCLIPSSRGSLLSAVCDCLFIHSISYSSLRVIIFLLV
jgi:hypothetical protein